MGFPFDKTEREEMAEKAGYAAKDYRREIEQLLSSNRQQFETIQRLEAAVETLARLLTTARGMGNL
jgi:AraC-like DNA-binding protein